MRTAIVTIPFSAIEESTIDGPIMTASIRNEMNGKEVFIEDESEYLDTCMIDWDRYDFVTVKEGNDVYSWIKPWLKIIKDDSPLAQQKIWSVWVDGFEMNSYILDYEQALNMRDDLMLEDDYQDCDIVIEDTYNLDSNNIKQLLGNLLKRYKANRDDMQEYCDGLEYEAAPSGEVNESRIPMDLAETEIEVYEEVIEDLEKIIENGVFG